MKLTSVQFTDDKNNSFKSTRTLKNTVSQLTKNNRYSLIEPNQRRISNSIKALGEIPGKKIIDFLINAAKNLTYSTNIKLEDLPVNNWKEMLLGAAKKSLSLTNGINKSTYYDAIKQILNNNNLTETEKEILKLRDDLLKLVNFEQIKRESLGGIQDFQRNLDYFIVSSETTIDHKKYVLSRLNYFMGDDYEINPQLADKKSVAVAEMVNDLAIFTPGHKIPNIKSVNQVGHGICAEISIVRKKLAYEDKPNYVDAILSELDASPYISVYSRSNLGCGEKIQLKKVPIDFDDALQKGYRIIDASSTQWMEIAYRNGYSGNSFNNYTSFDKNNFDINKDSFYNAKFDNPELQSIQEYYQALTKAAEIIDNYQADKIKNKIISNTSQHEFSTNVKAISNVTKLLNAILKELAPENNINETRKIINGLIKLKCKVSSDIKKDDFYSYIGNEEECSKKLKIKNYLLNKGISADKLDDNTVNRIYDLIDTYYSLFDTIGTKSRSKLSLQNVTSLYKIAAGIRYQYIKGLENEPTLNYMMKNKKIPNLEECILDTADTLINKLNGNSKDSDIIINSLIENVKVYTDNSSEELKDTTSYIALLEQIKNDIKRITTKEVDKIYKSLGLNNHTDAFVEYIESLQLAISNDKNPNMLAKLENSLNIKNSREKVYFELEKLKDGLITKKYTYDEVFNKLGSSSKIVFLYDMMNTHMNELVGENAQNTIDNFISINNLDLNDLENAIPRKYEEIKTAILEMSRRVDSYANILKITDKDGNILYSPQPSDTIIKLMENSHAVISTSALKELQAHLDNIKKEIIENEIEAEFKKPYKKIPKSFSNSEKNTLQSIENNLNAASKYIKKQLSAVQHYIKIPLEELKRIIGVNTGHWWVDQEGNSGLRPGEEVRILEYITGRSHYSSSNIAEAAERIKTTPYSGISASSVSHDEIAMHVQYIADIEPVTINNGTSSQTVDVMFHDNSWGAAENENTWVDSNGLVRTDYNRKYGGNIGYITNNKFRNGNILDRVLNNMFVEIEPEIIQSHQYRKLKKGDLEEYKFLQYRDISLAGKSPYALSTADEIHDVIFTPVTSLIDVMKNITKDMSLKDIERKIYDIKNPNKNWISVKNNFLKRIQDSKDAIITKEDYDKLPDTDSLKLALEITALKENYPLNDKLIKISEVGNIKNLQKYQKIQRRRAIDNIKYAFGKNMNIAEYLMNEFTENDINKIKTYLSTHNIALEDNEFENIFETIYEYKHNDGSLKHNINKIVNAQCKLLKDKRVSEEDIKNIKDLLTEIYSQILYFNESDINKAEISYIIKFLDKIYNPSDDNELVKIYRKIQNMTNDEFARDIIKKLTDSDLNIKCGNGYDILQRIQRYEESAENALINTIYADGIHRNKEEVKFKRTYTNYKLHRTPEFRVKYDFNSAYNEMLSSLSLLSLNKLFNKYKGINLEKYGVYPAYPKSDYITESLLNDIANLFIPPISDEIERIKTNNDLLRYYELSDELKNYSKQFKNSQVLSDIEREKIISIIEQIYELAYNDDTQTEVLDAAINILETDAEAKFADYKSNIKKITQNIDEWQTVASPEDVRNEIDTEKYLISKQSEMFIKVYIQARYQNKVNETLNRYKSCLIKQNNDDTDTLKALGDELMAEIEAYNILNSPEELLENYVKSLSADSPINQFNQSIGNLLKRALDYSKLNDVQAILMHAINHGIETDVKSAFNNIQVAMNNGSTLPMSSGKMIAYITHSLVLDDKKDTALLFLDKLGLNEAYVNYICKSFDYDSFKEAIEKIATVNKQYKEFIDAFSTNYIQAKEEILNSSKNPVRIINKFKKILLQEAKKYSIEKEHKQIFLSAVESCKSVWALHPNANYVQILDTIFAKASIEYENEVKNYFLNNINNVLTSQESIMDLVNNVPLNKDSKALKNLEELNNKYSELIEYSNRLTKEYLQLDE